MKQAWRMNLITAQERGDKLRSGIASLRICDDPSKYPVSFLTTLYCIYTSKEEISSTLLLYKVDVKAVMAPSPG